jgi:hypothetical protein
MNRWSESYQNLYMSVGVMEDYKLRDLRASHTVGGREERPPRADALPAFLLPGLKTFWFCLL